MMSVIAKSLGVNTAATPRSRSAAASASGMIPPTTTGTSETPAAASPLNTSGTSDRCDPERIDRPTRWTSSATAAATISAGVSRMPW